MASDPPPPRTTDSEGAVGAIVLDPVGDSCPLCGAPLAPEQEWCLRCGAAARTRLAASPHWKAPIIAIAVVVTLSLGVLAAALVKLAGNSGSPARTATATGAASVTSPGTATETSAPSATSPGATTPGASAPGAAAPVGLAPVTMLSSSAATLNGAVNPQGVPTTYTFRFRTIASHGWTFSHTPVALGAGTAAIAVNAKIAYLTPETTYHYELVVSKAGRTITTADATFTTLPAHSPPGARSTTPGKTGTSGPPR